MSALKLQVSRALRVIPSDNCNIPMPNAVVSGTNTGTSSSKLIASGEQFITEGVREGDIVYNLTDSTAATVVSVDSETQLTLNANIFGATSKSFVVYSASPMGDNVNRGCVFYTGGAGNVAFVTEGGDSITKEGCAAGQYHPVSVIKILSTGTTATLIDAHW